MRSNFADTKRNEYIRGSPTGVLSQYYVGMVGRRSRTGCLTCRQRKLKCDELRPVCGQCTKANRDCQPSDTITFRHQHNPSMNANEHGSTPEQGQPLASFYAYKNTFEASTKWVDIPQKLTFFHTSNPYQDQGPPDSDEAMSSATESPYPIQHENQWTLGHEMRDPSRGTPAPLHSHGLEALSAAALYTPPRANMISQSVPDHTRDYEDSYTPLHAYNEPVPSSSSPTGPVSTNNNLHFLLNPTSNVNSPIDPSLMSADINQTRPNPNGMASAHSKTQEQGVDGDPESEHKVAFLLRHFSESPGQWMDLFDLDRYFGTYVPVQARSHALLKHAACAYAAKQLGLAKGQKATHGGICSRQARMEIYDDSSVDWLWEGAYHYDRSIALLMETMQDGQYEVRLDESTAVAQHFLLAPQDVDTEVNTQQPTGAKLRLSSDEVVAATAILCVYEFVSATGTAWSRHLNGTKSLLDIAEGTMMPVGQQRRHLSKARRATFWNFARQDYLAAFINECQTRLDTENLQLWREAGLLLGGEGVDLPSNTTQWHLPSPSVMKEDMISNALIWLASRLCNFIAAGESFNPPPAGDRTESPRVDEQGGIGTSQKKLLEQWNLIQRQFDGWYRGLPRSFKPSARIKSKLSRPFSDVQPFLPHDNDCPFDEVWYSRPMCGATMQHYHMAQILLLINKPHETTARRTTIGHRFNSYQEITEVIVHHCYEICGIACSRPEASVRVHSTQPLFVAGQCFTHHREREVVLDLLRSIEIDLGWATEYRVEQLIKEWGWVADSNLADV